MKPAIRVFIAGFVLGMCIPVRAQASQSDSQTLRDILSELRAMHNDERLTAVSQILLVELETQQTVVNQAVDRANGARRQVSDLQIDEKRMSADLAHSQETLANETDSRNAKALSDAIGVMKTELVSLKARAEALNTNLQTDENQLRSAQDTLDDIQQRLEATIKKLEPVAHPQ